MGGKVGKVERREKKKSVTCNSSLSSPFQPPKPFLNFSTEFSRRKKLNRDFVRF
jgi:hypothetical protein